MPSATERPIRLLPIFRERVWGRTSLAPYFPDLPSKDHIGEVWFTFKENLTSLGMTLGDLIEKKPCVLGTAADSQHPDLCPLLVKLLFTTERLSVQVHPDDAYAQQHHQSLGKTEAWYVVAADPTAEVAVGFCEAITAEKLREAAKSGEIEELLDWRRVEAGDVIYTPAGTVHAIGAGLTICEIQENSDITYRLYDYGRPRELHLEHGARVSHLGRHEHHPESRVLAPWREELAAGPYFRIERLRPAGALQIDPGSPFYLLLICLKGAGEIDGERFEAGQCWMAPAGNAPFELNGPGSEWILTYTADRPTDKLKSEII